MAQRLAALADSVDPATDLYASGARAAALRARPRPPDPVAAIQLEAELAEELLRAGDLEGALSSFASVRGRIAELGLEPPVDFAHTLREQVAIAHLRRRVREACIDGRDARACSLPPRTRARVSEEPVRAAIAEYLEALALYPDDLRSRWLLNVAAMMIGRHPEAVPARWRIAPDAFASEFDVGEFPDIAPALGLDVAGRAGGVVVDDLDADGDLDIMASSRGLRDPLRYFENLGDGGFADRTAEAGLTGITGGVNLVQADYDNDGLLDVLVLRGGWLPPGRPSSLLRNLGGGRFEDVTERAGVYDEAPTQTAAWADFDGDGWVDLYVGAESSGFGRFPCRLFHNRGDGTFVDVARESGVDAEGFVKAVVWGDYDDDGRPDLFLSRLHQRNLLFRNEGPSGDRWTFRDVTDEAGVAEPVAGFPSWFWDYDNDGRLDLFVSGYRPDPAAVAAEYLGLEHGSEVQHLYRNQGDGTLREVAADVGLARVAYAMGANFGDLDNDGWLDLYLGTGAPDFRHLVPNRMFRSAAARRFQDVTTSGGFGHLGKGHGIAFADVDNDGDQDVYAVIGGAYEGDIGRNALYENPGHDRRWVTLRLEGRVANRSAIGARITLTVEGEEGTRAIHRVVGSGGSFGASSLQEEIGLGEATAIRELRVVWPGSGRTDVHGGLTFDRIYRVPEGEAPVPLEVDPIPLRRAP